MITKDQKKQILESELNRLERQQYTLETACKVYKKTGQEDQLKTRAEILIKTEQMIDEYKQELNSLDEE